MDDIEGCVHAARRGDHGAWCAIVDGHTGLVWSIIRGFRFDDDTAKDVFQTVWLRLAENLDRIRQPARLAGWLRRTARNECIGVVRQRTRVVPAGEAIEGEEAAEDRSEIYPEPGEGLERDERRRAVRAALGRQSERCQELLRLLVADPPATYEEIAEILDMPIGSIGPTRSRCLEALRASPEIVGISGGLRPS